ncbi:hypothetical protein B4102_3908 [Heyndrickxia sporothermodurans]|uniref:Uncharacterized protein n=1 Tax=Heyndrickxia sporothermodurans TaxID=46224 RepID=A0A150KLS2_9BACI|nr:hypothetical protein B4102_3908 [Heyndrickxia sporothermodurans]
MIDYYNNKSFLKLHIFKSMKRKVVFAIFDSEPGTVEAW